MIQVDIIDKYYRLSHDRRIENGNNLIRLGVIIKAPDVS
jgi:hypothetical protein